MKFRDIKNKIVSSSTNAYGKAVSSSKSAYDSTKEAIHEARTPEPVGMPLYDRSHRKSSTPVRAAKLTLAAGLLYGMAYCGASTVATSDYEDHHKAWLKTHVTNTLVEQDFNATIGGKKKRVTLVGETHIYNEKEAAYAKASIGKYDLVLYEGCDNERLKDIPDKLFAYTFVRSIAPAIAYQSMGDGRDLANLTLAKAAEQRRIPLLHTENDTIGGFTTFTTGNKLRLTYEGLKSRAIAPLAYWAGKDEVEHPKDPIMDARELQYNKEVELLQVSRRNVLMADEIARYLRERPEKRVLIGTGRGHFFGLRDELRKRMTLEELTAPHVPGDAIAEAGSTATGKAQHATSSKKGAPSVKKHHNQEHPTPLKRDIRSSGENGSP